MSHIYVSLRNDTDSNADMAFYHYSTNYGSVGITGTAVPPGGSIGPVKVEWDTSTPSDYWYASIAVSGGTRPGMYVSHVPSDPLLPYWKENMLVALWDDGTDRTFKVDWDTFTVDLKSAKETAAMLPIGAYTSASIQNIFVLMLENRSFDNMLGFSGIPGITPASSTNCNSYQGTSYCAGDQNTPTSMPTDPGHEFKDVLQQLGGEGATYTAPTYPPIDMSGFASSYATSTSEGTGTPAADQIGYIMQGFTPLQVPVLYQLASTFVTCNNWFSSLPGPTWPNRFYLHGASSAYETHDGYVSLDDSPSTADMALWESFDGFTYRCGSIFDALTAANIPWRIYHDTDGTVAGSVPQVCSLKNISLLDVLSVKKLSDFAGDISSGYPYRYTFIEPNYGDITGNTYKGGSSQHPEDDVAGGEALIAKVYNAIARSPLWPNSLLVITYDEHGGFYDSVVPGGTTPPDTDDTPGANGFIFNQLGVRVPAVIVSPFTQGKGVDQTVYDHSSVPRTIEELFGLQPLTARDANAQAFTSMLGSPEAATSPPPSLANARTRRPQTDADFAQREAALPQPLPEQGNIRGFVHVARKTDREADERGLARAEGIAAPDRVETFGDADAYIRAVMARVDAARAQFDAALHERLSRPGDKGTDKAKQ